MGGLWVVCGFLYGVGSHCIQCGLQYGLVEQWMVLYTVSVSAHLRGGGVLLDWR
ncbi:hypothetical protein BJ508DRAFT_412790 [Ascobolus immersus RN42]|uniref:Uncharacterized protein n=1 Tax=Ascobolus immersus RN42 TaxID=1160509 RepID=A0A3N4IE45_ASCIM|nr:hypothetical protein BJ508DRAFT_412790 [Ascobolus immersus RN42]